MSMTSGSMSCKPLLLSPAGKDYLWGGSRLKTDFGKKLPLTPLAETWECSTHPDGLTTVAAGECAGQPLRQVLREHPEYLGRSANREGELPILVKLIDAEKDLSVQVHPDDAYAAAHENGQKGKSEMWYVLEAEPNARLVYGFNRDMTPELLRESLHTGRMERYLQRVSIRPNDVFFIKAGTVHAIGAGALIVEVQENSNLTYRLYDYDRRDAEGRLRPLHLEKALEVADLRAAAHPRQPMRTLRYQPGCAKELLCRCRYFETWRLLLNTAERIRPLRPMDDRFRVLLCIDGSGTLTGGGETLPFEKGQCLFLPAPLEAAALSGTAQLIEIIG